MKKIVIIIVVIALILGSGVFTDDISVELDGKKLHFDVSPTIINGRTVLPARAIFESLGLEVKWDDATRTVTGIGEGTKLLLVIDQRLAHVNGEPINLDVAPTIIQDRSMLPVSRYNNPWWSFYKNYKGDYILDKGGLLERVDSVAETYHYYPDFDLENIKQIISELPLMINQEEYNHLLDENQNYGYTLMKNNNDMRITINLPQSKVLVNGMPTSFEAYTIEGNNYFKLRDIAYVFTGTEKQFDVYWDND